MKSSEEYITGKVPTVQWNKFEKGSNPEPGEEYLICTALGRVKISYFDGKKMGLPPFQEGRRSILVA